MKMYHFKSILLVLLSVMILPCPHLCSEPQETRFLQGWRPPPYEYGIASWYGKFHHGMMMANGKPFDMYAISVAHKKIPLGTLIRVTNLLNYESIDLVVTDRGPYIEGRVVDLSYAAARQIGMVGHGIVPCRVDIL